MSPAKLLPNILWPIIAVAVTNGLVFGLNWDSAPQNSSNWLNPPGELIGAVWVGLFLLMGIARYQIQKLRTKKAVFLARKIVWYMAFCLSYPFYTLGLSSETLGLIGNAATFMAALYLVAKCWAISRPAAWCLLPALPWIIYATATMIAG